MVKKPKFNFMDGLIIFIVIALIAGGFYILSNLKGGKPALGTSGQVGLRYKVEVTNVEKSFVDAVIAAVEKGGKCSVGEKEGIEAVVIDAEVGPTKIFTNNLETGDVLWVDSLNKYTVNLIVESKGTETETNITAGDETIKVGRTIAVRGKGFAGYGAVLDVETFDVSELEKEAK